MSTDPHTEFTEYWRILHEQAANTPAGTAGLWINSAVRLSAGNQLQHAVLDVLNQGGGKEIAGLFAMVFEDPSVIVGVADEVPESVEFGGVQHPVHTASADTLHLAAAEQRAKATQAMRLANSIDSLADMKSEGDE